MKKKHPIFLFSEIDEKYIEEANPDNFARATKRRKFFPILIAATLCISLILSLTVIIILNIDEAGQNKNDDLWNFYKDYPHLGEQEVNMLYAAKGYDEIAKTFTAIYSAQPSTGEPPSGTDKLPTYGSRPTHYFTLPNNNNPTSGTKGSTSLLKDGYTFNVLNNNVLISVIEGENKRELQELTIRFNTDAEASRFSIRALYVTDDRQALLVVLSDHSSETAIATFNIAGFESGKAATQKSFVIVSGNYTDSSFINGKLIITAEQRVAKETFNIKDFTTFLPYTVVDGVLRYTDVRNVYITPYANDAVYTTVAQFDASLDRLMNTKRVIGGHDVHMTESAVYFDKQYTDTNADPEVAQKSELWRFAYADAGLSLTGYQSIGGIINDNMLNESNGVLQVLSSTGDFYCFDVITGAVLTKLASNGDNPIYATVGFVGNKAYLGHYCIGTDCSVAMDKSSMGMIVWTLEVDTADPKNINTATPMQPYGSLLDFGDGYWLELKYEHSEVGISYALWVSLLKETDSGLAVVNSTVFENRSLVHFPQDRENGVIINEKTCDYYFDKENKMFGTLITPQTDGERDEYMLWQLDTETETLTATKMNTNKYHANDGGYYFNGYFFTVSLAGDLATKLDK